MNYRLIGKGLNEGQNRNSYKSNFQKDSYVKRVKKKKKRKKNGFSILCLLVKVPKKSSESTSKLKHYFILYWMSEDLLEIALVRKEKQGLPWWFSGYEL